MTTLNILWSDLVATPRNVRKVKTGIESLAASMASEDGQIQNLVVIAREDGKYQVIVGERRRRAAVHNVKTKVWGRDATLRCGVNDVDSLAAAMRAVYDDPALRESLRQKGFKHAQRFTWDKTARILLDLCIAVAQRRGN